jgi:hypothetical protein
MNLTLATNDIKIGDYNERIQRVISKGMFATVQRKELAVQQSH